MLRVVHEQPNLSVRVREEDALQVDHVGVLQLAEELEIKSVDMRSTLKNVELPFLDSSLTAISLQADMERPEPSICLSAYSFVSVLKDN